MMRNTFIALIFVTMLVPVAAYAGKGGGGGAAPTTNANGWLDAATCSTGNATGWSQDTDTPTNPVAVYFWIDSQPSAYDSTAGSVGSVSANQYRADLCSALGSCNHGFTWAIPAQYFDGQVHSLYAYGQDTSSANGTALSGVPKTFQCFSPPVPTGLTGSCPAPGTQGTLNWTPVSGATGYYIRINNTANPWSPSCTGASNDGNTGDICTPPIGGVPPYTFTSIAGATYDAWIHSNNSFGASNATSVSFTCQAPAPTCSVSLDQNPIPYGGNTTLRWSSANATSVYINSVGYVTPNTSGSASVAPLTATNYACTATGPGGTATTGTQASTLSVTAPSAPTVSATANGVTSATVNIGQSIGIHAAFAAGSGDSVTSTALNQVPPSGVEFTIPGYGYAPVSSYNYTFSPTLPGTYVFKPYIITSYFTSWATYGGVTVTVPVPPTATISLSPTNIAQGQSSTLTWSSTNATSCTISGVGTVGTSGSIIISPSQPTTYTGSCTGPGGTTAFSGPGGSVGAVLTVSCTPSYSCSNPQTILQTNANCSTVSTACIVPAFCSAGSAVCLYPQPSFLGSSGSGDFGALSGHLQVRPQIVRAGDTGKLYWNVSNVASCAVSGANADQWSGIFSGSTGKVTSPISQQTTFTLTCQALPGVTPASFSETTTINIAPVFEEI